MSKSEAGWELITQASHYSLPGIKYAACPWTWYSLSLCFYFRVSAWSFFFFLSKGEHPHKPPLSPTSFNTSSDNFCNFPETDSLISTQKVSQRTAFELFSPATFLFLLLSALVYTTESPLPLSPVPSGLCIHTKRTGCLQSCYWSGEVSLQTEVFQRDTSNYRLWELSAFVMYHGPFIYNERKTAWLLVC